METQYKPPFSPGTDIDTSVIDSPMTCPPPGGTGCYLEDEVAEEQFSPGEWNGNPVYIPPTPTPEPGTNGLALVGLLAIVFGAKYHRVKRIQRSTDLSDRAEASHSAPTGAAPQVS
jgi:hypothetical protein